MDRSLEDLAERMRDIDFAMLSTYAPGGAIGARPMSNNREVDYDGDSWFFTWEEAQMVTDIQRNAQVGLSFQGKSGLFGARPFFLAVEGEATIITDRSQFEAHWTKDLDRWFKQGPDTPGVVLIHVQATRAHYWDGEDEGEVTLRATTTA